MMPWRVFVVRTGVAAGLFGLAMFVALRLAAADPGGPTRPELAFSGVLSRDTAGAPFVGDTSLVFTFARGATTVCSVTTRSITFTATMNGAFTVPVPIGPPCPPDLFDGADVTYNVQQSQPTLTTIATNVPVTPVPYARFADTAGGIVDHACPAGYTRDGAASTTAVTVCARTVTLGSTEIRDEVVKVGTGRSAFWVDRFEASVHFAGTGAQLGTLNASGGAADNIDTSGLTRSGQRPAGEAPVRALSHAGQPSGNVTWFQANEACRASGKRLLLHDEWFAAASGTADDPTCNTTGAGSRPAAATNRCVSAAGVHDMIGNLEEWTAEWYTSVGQITSPAAVTAGMPVNGITVNYRRDSWPAGYGSDGTDNITSAVVNDAPVQTGVPSAAERGGSWTFGVRAGIFALNLASGPSGRYASVGFRCVVPG